jgi:hypothetical protein
MRIFFAFTVGLLLSASLMAASISSGDTLVNLNRLNRGVLSAQPGAGTDTSLFRISAEGLIIAKAKLPLAEFPETHRLSIKTMHSDKVYFDNDIVIYLDSAHTLIHVNSDEIEMATGMRSDGRIWVVVASSLLVFFTLLAYLIQLERKLR